MAKIFLALFVFFVFAYNNARRKHSWKNPSSFLLSIYLFSLLTAIIDIPLNQDTLVLQHEYWGASVFLLLMLLAFLWPFQHFNETSIQSVVLPNKKVLDVFSTFIIVFSLFSIIYYLPVVIRLFSYGDLGFLRNDRYATGEEYVEAGLLNTIASTGASFYVFALLLFFIYLIIGQNTKRALLLLISSFSEPIHILTFIGRDGVVFWIFSFFFFSLFFRDYLKKTIRRKLKRYFLLLSCALIIPFVMISIGRFEGRGVLKSIINYFGQPYVYGTLYFGIDDPPTNLGRSFPLFYEITGNTRPVDMGRWEAGGTSSWVFGTFVKSLYQSLGSYSALITLCIVAGFFFILVFGRDKTRFRFNLMFIYILYFQVLSQGVFYFRQYTRGGNLFILICLFLYVFFSIILKFEGSISLNKVE